MPSTLLGQKKVFDPLGVELQMAVSGTWDQILLSLQEQPVPLTNEPSLQPQELLI